MYRAGHLLRRSSVRLKSLSGGHSNLQIIISQLREVRTTFKAFVVAQTTLSEDLVKWSSTLENDAIHGTFVHLAELNSIWAEVQKDFADNLKHFRSNFQQVLEGERHVDQAKQVLTSREEIERDNRKELQRAYKKAPAEEIQILRERLNRSEKSKELAHIEVVERVRENEAVRMIRIKESLNKIGASYYETAQKASVLFRAHGKVVSEIPDVHDKALHSMTYRGSIGSQLVQEAKEQVRLYRATSTHSDERPSSYHDPPPPYTPSLEKLNDLTNNLSSTTLGDSTIDADISDTSFHHPSAPTHSLSSLNSPPCNSPVNGIYPGLENPQDRTPEWISQSFDSDIQDASHAVGDKVIADPPLLVLKASKPKKKHKIGESPNSASSSSESSSADAVYQGTSSPPPYNPFYEWSSFPKKKDCK